MHELRVWARRSILPCAVVAAVACSNSSKTDAPAAGPVARQSVGASGGSVAAADGTTLQIPPGALGADTPITLTPLAEAPAASGAATVGTAYLLGPEGTQFSKPVTVHLAFDQAKLPAGTTASDVVVLTAPAGSNQYVPLLPTPRPAAS
jgi:hypothetical protein